MNNSKSKNPHGYQVLIQRIEEQYRQQNQIEPEDIETLVRNDPELSIDDNSFFLPQILLQES